MNSLSSAEVPRKLNIAMVYDTISGYISGSLVSTVRVAELLRDRGHRVIFISSRTRRDRDHGIHNGMKVYRFKGIMVPKTESSFFISFPDEKSIEEVFIAEKIDVVHVLLPTPLATTSIKVAQKLNIKIVSHSHAQPENVLIHLPQMLSFIHKPFRDFLYGYLAKLYKRTDVIVYPTEFARKLFSGFMMGNRSVVVSNGVNRDIFKKVTPEPFFTKFNLPEGKTRILYVGRLHPEKNLETLVASMEFVLEKSPDAELWIVGGGHVDAQLKEMIADLGIEKSVILFGKISDEDLVLAYNACDIFVLPSLVELEGMVVLEAMACGKPIIVANSPDSASTYFIHDNGFLFQPRDPHDLADKITTLINDKSLRAHMAQQSFEEGKKYDINKSIDELEAVDYSLVGLKNIVKE